MLRVLLIVLVLVVPQLGFTQANSYTILAEDAAGLWGQADGTGCGNDLVVAAFEAAGVHVTLQTVPYARAKELVLTGQALGCFGMSRSPELEGKILFPKQPLYSTHGTLFAPKTIVSKVVLWKDLPPGSTVGIVRDYEYPAEFSSLVRSGALRTFSTNSEAQGLKMLSVGRLDYVICMNDTLKSAASLMKAAGVDGLVQPVLVTASQDTLIGFDANNPDSPRAIRSFDAGMEAIRANGVYQAILEKWLGKG